MILLFYDEIVILNIIFTNISTYVLASNICSFYLITFLLKKKKAIIFENIDEFEEDNKVLLTINEQKSNICNCNLKFKIITNQCYTVEKDDFQRHQLMPLNLFVSVSRSFFFVLLRPSSSSIQRSNCRKRLRANSVRIF